MFSNMNRLDMLKLWALGLSIPSRLFENDRVKTSIQANDPHGMLEDMRRELYNSDEVEGRENFITAIKNLNTPMYQLEVVMIFRQYPNESQPEPTSTKPVDDPPFTLIDKEQLSDWMGYKL